MSRFLKLTVLFAVAISLSAMANESFAKGKIRSSARAATKAMPARTHKHRINEYGNGLPNPNADSNGDESGIGTNYPAPVTFGSGDYGLGHGEGGGNPNPVKPHPRPIVTVPVQFPTGPSKLN